MSKNWLNQARQYCNKSEKCSADVFNILYKWGVPFNDSEKIVQQLTGENLINDSRYAELYIGDKFRINRWGRLKIIHRLRIKRIKDYYISQAIAQIDEDDYINTIKELIDRKRNTIHGKSEVQIKAKIFQFLHSKGFEKHLIWEHLGA